MSTAAFTCAACGSTTEVEVAAGGAPFATCSSCGTVIAPACPRIDYDIPTGDEIWVIRVEHATAGRLKATITQADLDHCGFTPSELIVAKTQGLAAIFERHLAEKDPE